MPPLKQLLIAYYNVWIRLRVNLEPLNIFYGLIVSIFGCCIFYLSFYIFDMTLHLNPVLSSLIGIIFGFLTMSWVSYKLLMAGYV
mgnify:CR=1 FL=1